MYFSLCLSDIHLARAIGKEKKKKARSERKKHNYVSVDNGLLEKNLKVSAKISIRTNK